MSESGVNAPVLGSEARLYAKDMTGALVQAMLAVAYELRTANLIAHRAARASADAVGYNNTSLELAELRIRLDLT